MYTNVTTGTFKEEVLNSNIPVVVDFWASWCGPCKMFAPIIEEFAAENAEKVKVCKVNVDEEQSLAQEYSVMSIPTVIVFKNGAEVNRSIGAVDKAELGGIAGV